MKISTQLIENNSEKYPVRNRGKVVKEYRLWKAMLLRCTDAYWKKHPTYTTITCSENFKSYPFFYEWCQEQTGFNSKDHVGRCWQLDKDLLSKHSKIYSEDTCCFIPQRINSLFTKSNGTRGSLPIGVCFNKAGKGFQSVCSSGEGKLKHLGYFNTSQEAFQAYKTYKEALIKEVANEYKEMLDSRVYEALMNYEVNEND